MISIYEIEMADKSLIEPYFFMRIGEQRKWKIRRKNSVPECSS